MYAGRFQGGSWRRDNLLLCERVGNTRIPASPFIREESVTMVRDWEGGADESEGERKARIDAMLAELCRTNRYGNSMSAREIAARCGCERSIIRKIETRAIKKVTRLLQRNKEEFNKIRGAH